CEVVIAACVEAAYTVIDCIPGGQEENRSCTSSAAELSGDREPISPGEHHVADDEIVRRSSRCIETRIAVERGVDDVSRFRQSLAKVRRGFAFILDYQDLHRHARASCRG